MLEVVEYAAVIQYESVVVAVAVVDLAVPDVHRQVEASVVGMTAVGGHQAVAYEGAEAAG